VNLNTLNLLQSFGIFYKVSKYWIESMIIFVPNLNHT